MDSDFSPLGPGFTSGPTGGKPQTKVDRVFSRGFTQPKRIESSNKMKLTTEATNIINAMQKVSLVTSRRASLPILTYALIETRDAGLVSVTATDLDNTARVTVPTVTGPECSAGSTCAPVQRMTSAVSRCNGEVELATVENTLAIRNGSQFSVACLGAEEFPQVPSFADQAELRIDSEALRTGLNRVAFSQSKDVARYVLQGVFVLFEPGKTSFVSTDGRRLTVASVANGETERKSLLLPTKAVKALTKMLPKPKKSSEPVIVRVAVRPDTNYARFLWEENGATVEFITRQIAGNFPNYKMVIPEKHIATMEFSREELAYAVAAAEEMTTEKYNSIKLTFTRSGLRISTSIPGVGESSKEVQALYTGEPCESNLTTAFDPVYIREALFAVKDRATVCFGITDERSPVTISTPGMDWFCVVMPMRLS